MVKSFVDIFLISESMLNDIFPEGQLIIDHYHATFRFDHNGNGSELLLYVREDLPAKVLHFNFPNVESSYAEIILHKKSCLINCYYNLY